MKNKLIKLISVSEDGLLEVVGIGQSIHCNNLHRTGLKVLVMDFDMDPDVFIQKEYSDKSKWIPENSTAYELSEKVRVDRSQTTHTTIYCVIFYKGISLKVEVNTTNIRHERYEQK